MHSIHDLQIDEFCTIWLNQEILNQIDKIEKEQKEMLLSIMSRLDRIIEKSINPSTTEEEKIDTLLLYVIEQIEYDFEALKDTTEGNTLKAIYNNFPITMAFLKEKGICVGDATLFTALATRAGINCYQPASINHTWNMIKKTYEEEYMAYDITPMDDDYAMLLENGKIVQDEEKNTIQYILEGNTEQLLYYDLDLSTIIYSAYETDIAYKEVERNNIDIGYLKEVSSKRTNKNDISSVNKLIFLFTVLLYIVCNSK